MRTFLTIFVTLITLSATNAQTIKLNSDGRDKDYVNTILERSKKVTDALNITGTEKGTHVLNIVANRYFELNDIYEERDSLKKAASSLTGDAKKQAKQLTEQGFGQYPICMAKTQYSFSDDPKLLGAPENFTVTVRNIKVSAGAGFLVALTGDILTMPGLPKVPAAEKIDVDEHGKISGLF